MTTTPNTITPPAELVWEWTSKWNAIPPLVAEAVSLPTYIATRAAQWGYQQAIEELETFLRKADDKG